MMVVAASKDFWRSQSPGTLATTSKPCLPRQWFLEARGALHGGIDARHALDHGQLAAILAIGDEPAGGTHAIVLLNVADVVLGRGDGPRR